MRRIIALLALIPLAAQAQVVTNDALALPRREWSTLVSTPWYLRVHAVQGVTPYDFSQHRVTFTVRQVDTEALIVSSTGTLHVASPAQVIFRWTPTAPGQFRATAEAINTNSGASVAPILDDTITVTSAPAQEVAASFSNQIVVSDNLQTVWQIDGNGKLRPAATNRDVYPLTDAGADLGATNARYGSIYGRTVTVDKVVAGSLDLAEEITSVDTSKLPLAGGVMQGPATGAWHGSVSGDLAGSTNYTELDPLYQADRASGLLVTNIVWGYGFTGSLSGGVLYPTSTLTAGAGNVVAGTNYVVSAYAVEELLYDPSRLLASPNAYDDEFSSNASVTNLASTLETSRWLYVTATPSNQVAWSNGALVGRAWCRYSASWANARLLKAIPTPPYRFVTLVSSMGHQGAQQSTATGPKLLLAASTNGASADLIPFYPSSTSAGAWLMSALTTYGSQPWRYDLIKSAQGYAYFSVSCESDPTNIVFAVSRDGHTWASVSLGLAFTPTAIGLGWDWYGSPVSGESDVYRDSMFHWFRRLQ